MCVCVCPQTVAVWVRREQRCSHRWLWPPPHSPPMETWNTIWSQQMGMRPLGARQRCVLCCFFLKGGVFECVFVCECVCAVKDSSRLMEAQPTAAETRSSTHSWQLCQQHGPLHQEARWGPRCSSVSGLCAEPSTLWETVLLSVQLINTDVSFDKTLGVSRRCFLNLKHRILKKELQNCLDCDPIKKAMTTSDLPSHA